MNAPALRADVFPAKLNDLFVRVLQHPQPEPHRPAGEVIVDMGQHLQLCFLNDVGRVVSSRRIDSPFDEPADFDSVLGQQFIERSAIPFADAFQGLSVRIDLWSTWFIPSLMS